ncbi:MAG: hypothetical protein Kow0056_13520 [Coriobacteriia bacterium]
MARQYVCGICGRSVAQFSSWSEIEPSDLIELLREELEEHNVNTTGMSEAHVLARFRIVDDED